MGRCCSRAVRSTPRAARVERSPEARRRVVGRAARTQAARNRAARTPGRCARVARTRAGRSRAVRRRVGQRRAGHSRVVRRPGTAAPVVPRPGTADRVVPIPAGHSRVVRRRVGRSRAVRRPGTAALVVRRPGAAGRVVRRSDAGSQAVCSWAGPVVRSSGTPALGGQRSGRACQMVSPRRRTRCAIRSARRLGRPPRRGVARSAVPGSWGCPSAVPAPPVLPARRSTPRGLGLAAGVARRPPVGTPGRPSADGLRRRARPVAAARPALSADLQALVEASGRPLAGMARAVTPRRAGGEASQARVRPSAWAAPGRSRKLPADWAPSEGREPASRWRCRATWVWRVRVPLEGFVGAWPAVAVVPRVRRRAAGYWRRAASRRGSPATGSDRRAPTGQPARLPRRGPDRA